MSVDEFTTGPKPPQPVHEGAWSHSPTIGKLAEALAKAQAQFKHAGKSADNPFFKSKYADLPAVIDACRPSLAAHGLAVMQPATADGNKVTVTTILAHASGEWIASPLTAVAKDGGPQSIGSSTSYLRRYGLSSMVGVGAENEDDDGEQAEGRQADRGDERQGRRQQRAASAAEKRPPAANGSAQPPPADDLTLEVRALVKAIGVAVNTTALEALLPRLKALPDLERREIRGIYAARKVALEKLDPVHGADNLPPGMA